MLLHTRNPIQDDKVMNKRPNQEKKPGESILHIIVPTEAKAQWVGQAQAEGKKLADWVREQLAENNQK
jgi:hypothetical protein